METLIISVQFKSMFSNLQNIEYFEFDLKKISKQHASNNKVDLII